MADISPKNPNPESKPGFFSGKSQVQESAPPVRITEDVNAISARLKISEERYNDLRKKMLLIEQNMISNHKKAMNEVKMIDSDIAELHNKINMLEERMILIVKELKLTAKKEDVDVMKKYVELWNPMRFVTRETVESVVKDVLNKNNTSEKE
ncbi:hypothetical protein KY333_05400 [Candidatus Woesearchaeota archaeon]|nr:hypothetical protein [Candidatus Woesearchaeota archaeon]MBW2993956.1 hypothetical protein [Candidatus Woesearchaeota archaeon]